MVTPRLIDLLSKQSNCRDACVQQIVRRKQVSNVSGGDKLTPGPVEMPRLVRPVALDEAGSAETVKANRCWPMLLLKACRGVVQICP